MASYTLGLDIGSNSVGWAVVETGGKPEIVDLGVRVFPEEGKGASVARGGKKVRVSQRAKRGVDRRSRRCGERRVRRREKLVDILVETGLLPSDKEELGRLLAETDPYELRARGLDKPLKSDEFGRVLVHLNKRRGYRSNRKGGDGAEDKMVKKHWEELKTEMGSAGARTLGEYLYKVGHGKVEDVSGFEEGRIRNRRTFRKMYEDEFEQLWEEQGKYHGEVLTGELKDRVYESIFYQRPPKYKEPGVCELDGEPRAMRACWAARQFKLWQTASNFRVESKYKEPQPLEGDHREELVKWMARSKSVKFGTIRKKWGDWVPEDATFNFEEDGRKKTLAGDEFLAEIRRGYSGNRWDALCEEEQRWMVDLLAKEEEKGIRGAFRKRLKMEEETIGKLLKIHIPEGRMSFSEEAIERLLPYLRDGKRTDEAIALAYPVESPVGAGEERLPPVEAIENHVVMKAMCGVRKLVNCIIDEYGKPSRIKVELARDLNKSRAEKDKIRRENEANAKRNQGVREKLKQLEREYGVQIPPSRDNVVKYRLWEETWEACIYCGRKIHPSKLFGEYADCEVEHILPRKRSLQPHQYANKTISHVRCNKLKDNKTPFEAYKDEPEEYRQLLKRVFASKMPKAKKMRFLQEDVGLDKSVERNMNDARYIARTALGYLRKLGGPVMGTKGMATGLLRREAGFDTLLEALAVGRKHEDNRNHAIDAVVVALTTGDLLRNLARKYVSGGGFRLAELWGPVRRQLEEKLPGLDVSYRPRYRISDYLHLEQPFGLTDEVKEAFSEGRMEQLSEHAWLCREKLPYVSRKTLVSLINKVGDIDLKIPTDAVNIRSAIEKQLKREGIDVGNPDAKVPKITLKGLHIESKDGRKILVKKIRVRSEHGYMVIVTDSDGNPYKAYPTKNNHHIEIVKDSATGERRGIIVTQIEAARRWATKKAIVEKKHDGAEFVMSLCRNEMFLAEMDDGSEVLHRVEKMSEKGIILRPHTYGGVCSDYDKPPLVLRRSPNTLKGHKVTVDLLGRVQRAND